MIRFLKTILTSGNNNDKGIEQLHSHDFDNEKKIQIAACTLLVEMGKADSNFTDDERQAIISIMQDTFNLEEDYIKELIELSESKASENDSIYEYATLINNNFTNEEKFNLLKNLWRLIFIDDNLDKYEERLVKKIGVLLNIEYSNIISAKLIVKEEMK
jgi:uncharacterized tellurite resistance protein B-like protein